MYLFFSFLVTQNKFCVTGDCENGSGTALYIFSENKSQQNQNYPPHIFMGYYFSNRIVWYEGNPINNVYSGEFEDGKFHGYGEYLSFTYRKKLRTKLDTNIYNHRARNEEWNYDEDIAGYIIAKGEWFNGDFSYWDNNIETLPDIPQDALDILRSNDYSYNKHLNLFSWILYDHAGEDENEKFGLILMDAKNDLTRSRLHNFLEAHSLDKKGFFKN